MDRRKPVLEGERGGDECMLQRLGVICEAIGLQPAMADAKSDANAQVVSFIATIKKSVFTREQIIHLVYQLVCARLPEPGDIESLSPFLENESEAEFLQRIMNENAFLTGVQAIVEFELPPTDALLVDVSHTLRFAYTSGIQRVVRCLTQNLRRRAKAHQLIELDRTTGNYRLVGDRLADSLHNWEANKRESPLVHKANWLRTRIRKLAGRRLREKLAKLSLKARAAKGGSGGNKDSKREKVLFMWNAKLLLPELVADKEMLGFIVPLLTHSSASSTLIVFDMISLKNPEYFLATEGFVRYLSLFRCVDRISCISRAVEEDVRQFLPLVDREKAPPSVETHYLGGDFDAQEAVGGDSEIKDAELGDKPIVLTVGSIEIRKNHRRILRAMVMAQKAGYRFKGVFAGNPGWLNEGFLKELGYFQGLGFDLELRRSVGENELLALYRKASFTVYCSLAEGFGLPIVESVVRGVPCITSNRGCMKEIANQLGGCVLADPTSESEISSAIQDLLGDPVRLALLTQQASDASWVTWAEYSDSIYEYAVSVEDREMVRGAA